MTTNSHPKSTLVTQSVFVDDPVSGRRNIDSFGSILQVCAGPFTELARMMTSVSPQAHVAYLIDTAEIYTGHGNDERKIGERLEPEELKAAQVYVIHSLDQRYDKRVAAYVEARLIDVACELGVPLANIKRPFGRNGLRICPNQEQLVVHAQFLLAVAGFRRFEEARQDTTARPARVAATADLHDLFVVEPQDLVIPTTAEFKRLVHTELQAEGYRAGKRFLVMPGADYCYETKSGVSTDNQTRRNGLKHAGVLEKLPGVTGRARLRVALDCRSASIAATLITGEHLGNSAWTAAPLPAPGEAGAA
jgi:hypothetical protein